MIMTIAACAVMVVSASAADVKEIWAKSCAKCHGPDGKGDTKMGKKLEIKGVAQSSTRVSTFMRNIDASSWMDNPQLQVV